MIGYLGHTIVNGELKYGSVSSVKLFDNKTRGGCPRRWHKRYKQGIREPETDNMREAKEAGLSLDKEVKHYLLTGEKNLSALAIKGLHILEKPGPQLAVDVAMHTTEYFLNGQPFAALPPLPDGSQAKYPEGIRVQVESALTAGGLPFVGELDIVQSRGHFRDDDGTYHQDPPGTIEVADLKYKSSAKDREGNSLLFAPNDLVRDIQMAGYGEWVARVRPNASHVRLSHLYFPKKPAGALPTKVTKLHVIDDCRRTWEYVDGLVRYMRDVAKETDFEKVPGADRYLSCDAYGGCPYRDSCSVYKQTSLDNLYNKVAEDHLKEKNVGLIAQTQPQLMQQQGPAPAPQQNMQQQLAAEENAMRQQVAQQQQQMPTQFNAQEFLTVCHRLGTYGFGMPSLAGNAAQAYAAAAGQSVAPGFVFQGMLAPPGAQFSLHQMTLTEVAQVYQIEREAAAKAGVQLAPQQTFMQAQAPAPVQAPPGANTFTHQLANAYNATMTQQAISNMPQAAQPSNNGNFGTPSFLPPGAPESMPQLAQQQSAPPAPQAEAPAAEAPKGPGRPRKKKNDSGTAPETAAPPAAQTAGAPPTLPSSAGAPTQVAPAAGPTSHSYSQEIADRPDVENRINHEYAGAIFVNARCEGITTKSLAGYVDYLNETIAKRYNTTKDGKQGPLDVRAAVDGSILGYGGWKGVVREIVVADPPPPDAYHFDTFMSELNEVVADALRVVAERKGWQYVRGIR